MKIGVIAGLALAIVVVQPRIGTPAFSEFAGGQTGPVWPGSLFPFLFVTIACGALSGFQALISSGTTPKMVEKERQTRFIGYGGMLMEAFVAIMALVAAVSLDRGIHFAMNSPAALTGGAPTLAVGLAHIMGQLVGGDALMGFWHHFAIMFEALFILTAVDAGTRVARFMLQDSLGNVVPRFKDTSWRVGAWVCTAIMVAAWGAVLIMGVTDPLGGINTLFPLFGIANQLLAAIALAVVLTIVARRRDFRGLWIVALPLAFITVVTTVASFQKIFSSVPAVGYWAQHRAFQDALAAGKTSFGAAKSVPAMEAVVRNTFIQGTLSIVFLVLALVVITTSVLATVRAFRGTEVIDHQDPYVPSQRFAPAGLCATAEEKELQRQGDALPADRQPVRGH